MTTQTQNTPDLRVKIGTLELANPVLTASGTFGYGAEFAALVDLARLGGIVTKGISLKPRPGNPPPRIVETAGGMLNAIGLQNPGIDRFISDEHYLPYLRTLDCAVIVNIWGKTVEQYAEVARRLDAEREGIAALEINISCRERGRHRLRNRYGAIASRRVLRQKGDDTAAHHQAEPECDAHR